MQLVDYKFQLRGDSMGIAVKLFCMLVLLVLCGCTTHYFNLNYPDNQQQKNLAIDSGYCTQVSYGSVPMPQVQINNNIGSTTTSGNIRLSGPNGNYQGRYNATTTYNGNFISGFADGMNIGSAIAANIDRSNVYDSCLARLGWFRIEGSTYIRPSADFGAEPGANSIFLQKSIDELIAKGFITPVSTISGKNIFLFKRGSARKEGSLFYLTAAEIYPSDIMQQFPGTTPQGVTVAYRIDDYLIDLSVNRNKILRIEVFNRNNEKLYTHIDSEMNSITSAFKKSSIIDEYLKMYNKDYNSLAIDAPPPARFSSAESYANAFSYLSGQGFSDPLFDKDSLSQIMIKKDSITKNGDKLSYTIAKVFDIDRMAKNKETDTAIVYIAYYKMDCLVDINTKRLKIIGYKAFNRKNEEIISHINSDMEASTTEIAKTSVADRFLKKYSPEYATNAN